MESGFASCKKSVPVVAAAVLLWLLVVSVLAGCGSNTPQGAVSRYLNTLQSGDWEAFKATVVPQNFTKEQNALAKDKFEQMKVKFEDVETRTMYDQSDKNKATVVMTGGKVTTTANILGKEKTETVDIKKLDKPGRTYETVRKDGNWVVDTKL
jgi:hypothetical protein